MFAFAQQQNYTIQDVFSSLFHHAEHLPAQVPEDQQGRLGKYIDISRRIEEHTKPENFTLGGLDALLNEYDDGKSEQNPAKYKRPVPLVKTRGEYLFAKLMRDHMQQVLQTIDKIDHSQYTWYQRGLMKWGMKKLGPKYLEELDNRLDKYESKHPEAIEINKTWTPLFICKQQLTFVFEYRSGMMSETKRETLKRNP